MKFLDGYKTWIGLAGTFLYAAARTIYGREECAAQFTEYLTGSGLDVGGGMALLMLALGLVHKAEKRAQP